LLLALALGFGLLFAVSKGILWYTVYWMPDFPDDSRICIAVGAVGGLACAIAMALNPPWKENKKHSNAWWYRSTVRRMEKDGGIFVGYHCELTLVLEELVLTVAKENAHEGSSFANRIELHIRWEHVRSIELTDRHAFITIDPVDRFCCIFVPKSAFPNDGAFKSFVETANRLRHVFPTLTGITAAVPPSLASVPTNEADATLFRSKEIRH